MIWLIVHLIWEAPTLVTIQNSFESAHKRVNTPHSVFTSYLNRYLQLTPTVSHLRDINFIIATQEFPDKKILKTKMSEKYCKIWGKSHFSSKVKVNTLKNLNQEINYPHVCNICWKFERQKGNKIFLWIFMCAQVIKKITEKTFFLENSTLKVYNTRGALKCY